MVNGTGLVAQIRNTPVIPHSLAIWGLGQMGLIVKAPDAVIYIDPYLSDSVFDATRDQYGAAFQRAFPPPLKPEEATNADYILCTHEHMDHLDVQTIGPMAQASPNAKIITTGWGVELLTGLGIAAERIIVPEALQPLALPGTSIRLTAVPSAHYEKEFAPQKGYRYLGFLIEWNGVVLYHAGDTVIYPGYLETLR